MSVFPFIPTSTVTLVWRLSSISTWNHFPSKTNRCPWTHQGVVVWFQCFTPTVSAMFVQSCFNQLKHIKHTPSKGVSNNIEKGNQRYIFIKIPWMWEHRLVFTAWHFPAFCLFEKVSCCEQRPVYVCGSTHTTWVFNSSLLVYELPCFSWSGTETKEWLRFGLIKWLMWLYFIKHAYLSVFSLCPSLTIASLLVTFCSIILPIKCISIGHRRHIRSMFSTERCPNIKYN